MIVSYLFVLVVGAFLGDVTHFVALVALLFVSAILGDVASLTAAIAGLDETVFITDSFFGVVGAVLGDVTRAAAVVALLGVLVATVTGEVTGLATVVAGRAFRGVATTVVRVRGDAFGGTVVGEVTNTTAVVALAVIDEVVSGSSGTATTAVTAVATTTTTRSVVRFSGSLPAASLVTSGFLLLLTLLFGAVELSVALFTTEVATHVGRHDDLVFC